MTIGMVTSQELLADVKALAILQIATCFKDKEAARSQKYLFRSS
jgi:hypothetical protein